MGYHSCNHHDLSPSIRSENIDKAAASKVIIWSFVVASVPPMVYSNGEMFFVALFSLLYCLSPDLYRGILLDESRLRAFVGLCSQTTFARTASMPIRSWPPFCQPSNVHECDCVGGQQFLL